MNFAQLFAKFKIYLLVFALSLAIGAVSGFYVSNKLRDAALLKITERTKDNSFKSIEKSNAVEGKVAVKKQATEVRYKTITKEIIKYVPETILKECKTESDGVVATTLNSHAVSLLNSTDDANFQPTDIHQSQNATEVGLRELSDYIVTIKKDYTDLAVEHDALIEYNDFYKNLTK